MTRVEAGNLVSATLSRSAAGERGSLSLIDPYDFS